MNRAAEKDRRLKKPKGMNEIKEWPIHPVGWSPPAADYKMNSNGHHLGETRPHVYPRTHRWMRNRKIILISASILLGLLGLRHLNTVPQREWSTKWSNNAWTETVPAHWQYVEIDHSTGKLKWITKWVPEEQVSHPASNHQKLLYTVEGLFGSSYRVRIDNVDQGVSYKNFRVAFLQTFGTNDQLLKIVRTIDP